MELDRNAIERRDFPASRRGYDPAQVDAHLARIADAVEALRGASAAGTAAQRVRGIVEAAERSAAEIEAGAREEAERSRLRASAEAAESLRRAEEAEGLLDQASAELERLRGALAQLRGALEPQPEPEDAAAEDPGVPEPGEPGAAEATEPEPAEAEAATAHAELPEADEPVEEAQDSPAEAAYEAAPPAKKGGKPKDGAESARLIALNMALNGTPREETERYLAENFELEDPGSLLDEVYAG